MKKKTFLTACLALMIAVVCAFNACGQEDAKTKQAKFKPSADANPTYTYNIYTAVSPSNWNELTYLDNNDRQVMNYIGSSFFSFDYKYDDAGKILDGEFVVNYDFATGLKDVTADYVGQYGVREGDSELVWEITIRTGGKWDDGTPIKAEDFVYSMKEQLNPLFKNRRADSFYNGSVNIYKAWNYVMQGSTGVFSAKDAYGVYAEENDGNLIFCLGQYEGVDNFFRTNMNLPKSYDAAKTAAYLKNYYISDLDTAVVATMEGKTFSEIKADAAMLAEWNKIIRWWQTEPNEELHFFVINTALPSLDFEEVGIKSVGDNKIIVAMTSGIPFLDKEGKLTYHAPYEFASLPLVKKALYESCKVAPTTEGGLWTSTYNTSLQTTASWGPYKLTTYQAGKTYTLSKNENWYGYSLEENKGLYQTDKIVCETIEKYSTAFLKFQNGELDDIGIDVSVAADYKYSDRAYFTPDDFVGSIQLQSNAESLKSRGDSEKVNKMLLKYKDFRNALAIGIDRTDFVNKTTTSSQAGYGLYNSMHYYDVANGGVYRNTDYAKRTLCDVYGVKVEDYGSLDDAVGAITGYNPTAAKALIDKAYDEAFAAGEIKATDTVKFTMGSAVINEAVTRQFTYLKEAWTALFKGTKLEGRFDMELKSFGDDWAKAFKDRSEYDVCLGGWTGAAWNPGYFIMAYLSPDYMYSASWNTSSHMLEATVHGVKMSGDGKLVVTNVAEDAYTATLPLFGSSGNSWYELLNGTLGDGKLNAEFRCELLAQMEEEVLVQYYTIPYANRFVASLISFKTELKSYTYNTFTAYGGIKYMTYNYSDAQWAEFVNYMGGSSFDYR